MRAVSVLDIFHCVLTHTCLSVSLSSHVCCRKMKTSANSWERNRLSSLLSSLAHQSSYPPQFFHYFLSLGLTRELGKQRTPLFGFCWWRCSFPRSHPPSCDGPPRRVPLFSSRNLSPCKICLVFFSYLFFVFLAKSDEERFGKIKMRKISFYFSQGLRWCEDFTKRCYDNVSIVQKSRQHEVSRIINDYHSFL